MVNRFLLLISLTVCLISCKKETINTENKNCIEANKAGLLILNEGNYGWGISDISFWETKKSATNGIFQCQNNGLPLGNIGQSLYLDSAKNIIFAVINNSGKIALWDSKDKHFIQYINVGNSPRYMVNNFDKYFVSDIYKGKITVLNRQNFQVRGTIPTANDWSEELYITPNNYLITRLVNRITDTENIKAGFQVWQASEPFASTDTMYFNSDLAGLVPDGSGGFLSVLCAKSSSAVDSLLQMKLDVNGKLQVIKYALKTTESNSNQVTKLAYSEIDKILYFIKKNVYMSAFNGTESDVMSTELFAGNNSRQLYGLYVSNATPQTVYVANAKDYVRNGIVYSIATGSSIATDSAEVGVLPQAMLWLP